jgi:hypothetical protein
MKTSDRFLWILLLTQESFQIAGASPWPLNSLSGEDLVMKRVKRLRKWIIFVRDMRISSIKLNITYSKIGARSEAAATTAIVTSSSSRSGTFSTASNDVMGSSFSSVQSGRSARGGGGGASMKATTVNGSQRYQSVSINQMESGQQSSRPPNMRGRGGGGGSDSSLAFLLRNLKVGISGAQIELRGATIANWRGSRGALRMRLMHHYVAQLKQWTFTLLSSAAPGFGWRLFNRTDENSDKGGKTRRKSDKRREETDEDDVSLRGSFASTR